ncbi:acyl-CoA thioesterase [Paenibacillus sp. HN-1]|uniref:acyl-CoA thioesterase n=1 Tax=Paenibacillus TaxID=44249 RepID=UPI001CA88819|nr:MULTISPECIES: thioesterase family protein [Paenibacillus]MBY9080343.1 acyl-CoA thioesterase [Paenibacillus sp. CGMCC 1.18879]MBY9082998.1 acyl-CoA thioesterase [Paenibacillus sinensis]
MNSQDLFPGPWHAALFRVRYQESDQMGVVYHSNYLNWFEIGRTEMLRELGFTYAGLESQGVLLPVLSAELNYKRSARYDDLVAVYTRMTAFTPLRIAYAYEIRRAAEERPGIGCPESGFREAPDGELLVTGSTAHAWVSREMRPVRLDRTLPDAYNAILAALGRERRSL